MRIFVCLCKLFESGFFRKQLGFWTLCVMLNTERKDCHVCSAAVDWTQELWSSGLNCGSSIVLFPNTKGNRLALTEKKKPFIMLQNGIIFLFAISWCPAGPLIAVLCPEHVSGTSSHHGLSGVCLPMGAVPSPRSFPRVEKCLYAPFVTDVHKHLQLCVVWQNSILLLWSVRVPGCSCMTRTAFCPVRSPSCNNAVGYTEVPTCTLKLRWIIFFDILDNLCTNRGRGVGQLAVFF